LDARFELDKEYGLIHARAAHRLSVAKTWPKSPSVLGGLGAYALRVATTAERLRDACAKADRALASVRGDPGASPVLLAVVSEFAKKAE
jgi:hypothetical protein